MKIFVLILSFAYINTVFAAKPTPSATPSALTPTSNSAPVHFSEADLLILKNLVEKEKLAEYTGNEGSAPKGVKISTINVTAEEARSGPEAYVFWSQTLANGIYYQFRLTGKYALHTEPPPFEKIPFSSENTPNGYKGMVKVGYDVHLTSNMQLIPFLRLELAKNMTLVYQDREGDYRHSTNYALLSGCKLVIVAASVFSPYVELYGGIIPVSLTGNLIEGPTPNKKIKGFVQQYAVVNEFGFAYKIAEHQALIPFIQFIYRENKPNPIAATPYSKGGFNIYQLTISEQVFGIKYSYFW